MNGRTAWFKTKEPSTPKRRRVLLAHDQEPFRLTVKRKLVSKYNVTMAESAEVAIELIRTLHQLDILLTHARVGHSDALSLARATRQRFPAAAILVIVEVGGEDATLDPRIGELLSLPRTAALTRPFAFFRLREALKDLMSEQWRFD